MPRNNINCIHPIISMPRLRGLASPARAPHTSPGRQAWVRNGPLISGLKGRHHERRFIEPRVNIPHNVPTLQAGIYWKYRKPRPNDLGYYVTALQALPCRAITLNVFTIFFQCRPINKNVSLIFFQCHAIILIVFTQ